MKKAIENIFTFVSIREIPPHTSLFYPLAPLFVSIWAGSWLHMQMKLKVRDASLSRLLASSERDAVDYFLITKAKLWWEYPLQYLLWVYPPARLASFNLSAMAQVKKFSPIPNPIGIGRCRWMRQDEAETRRRRAEGVKYANDRANNMQIQW